MANQLNKKKMYNDNQGVVPMNNSFIPYPMLQYRPQTYVWVIIGLLVLILGGATFTYIKFKNKQNEAIERLREDLRPIPGIEVTIDSLQKEKIITLESVIKEQERLKKVEEKLRKSSNKEITLDEALKILNGL